MPALPQSGVTQADIFGHGDDLWPEPPEDEFEIYELNNTKRWNMTIQEIMDSNMTPEEMDKITGTSVEVEKSKIAKAKKALQK